MYSFAPTIWSKLFLWLVFLLRNVASVTRSTAVGQSSLNRSVGQPSLLDTTSNRADGNNVDIDREMEMLGEANLNYSALTQVNRLTVKNLTLAWTVGVTPGPGRGECGPWSPGSRSGP